MLFEKTFNTGNVSINYASGPAHGRPVVFLHGVTNRWQSWLPVLPTLAGRYHCFAVDMRGHGQSSHQADGYRCELFAEDIVRFLENVVQDPAILVGHSLGGMVSIATAARAPNLVEALCLEDPPLGAAQDFGDLVPPWFQSYLDILNAPISRAEKKAKIAELFPGTDEASQLFQLKSLELLDQAVLKEGSEGNIFATFTLAAALKAITCPMFLIRGNPQLGGVISDGVMQRSLLHMQNPIVHYRSDMGHNLHTVDAQAFIGLAMAFFEGI